MAKHSIYSHKYKERAVPVGGRANEDKFPEEDTRGGQSQFLSAVVTNDGVYLHVKHILAHLRQKLSLKKFQHLEALYLKQGLFHSS